MSGFEARRLRDYFDGEAERYQDHREGERGFQAQLAVALAWLPPAPGRVLDVGCATGPAVSALRAGRYSVVGVDSSPAMLARAARRSVGDPGVAFCRADAEALPIASGGVDHVLCLGVLEYLELHEPALAELARVLRPGGTAILSVPSAVSPRYWGQRARSALRGVLCGPPRRTHPLRNPCVPWRLLGSLRRHGLRPVGSRLLGWTGSQFLAAALRS